LKDSYIKQKVEIDDIAPLHIRDVLLWKAENLSLFSSRKIFFTQHLDATVIRKRGKKSTKIHSIHSQEEIAAEIAKRSDIELVVWEEKAQRELKLKSIATIKEFKLSNTIFSFLDQCVPGCALDFCKSLDQLLSSQQDPFFIFIMLYRHIRALILAANHVFTPTTMPWQRSKLSLQAKKWDTAKLVSFYEGLYRIELGNKTGTNPYGIKKSLEILACYYL